MKLSLERDFVDRWLWLCPALAVALAAAVLMLFGVGPWSALLAALLLVCPAIVVWGGVAAWRDERRRGRSRWRH